ncbi:MAG: T9SS type A sorting domain-containing protein, partial [Flavobacteriales bacterium]
ASSCSGPFTLIKCDNASGPGDAPFMTLTPLEIVPGETYYLRVWGNGGTTGTFNLCSFTAPATGDCIYVLRMWDSQGDGWGNSRVTIQVGASPAVDYWNANADEDVAYIPVSTGQNVTLSYATGGSGGQGQIRYTLQLINGPLYMDGPTPGTGFRWAGTANCQSAAPLPSDCIGGSAICGAQQISANPSNTGLAQDLNHLTRGCLGANERQGYWYKFTISGTGLLGFTISPNDPGDDYDFGIWGPYGSFSCPPREAPVRCNYSGTPGNTGLSALGTNPSEGGGGNKWSTRMPVTVGENYLLYVSNWSQSGLAFDLSWQLESGASLDCNLLPVQLLGLNGAPVPSGIQLEWQTATESNSAFFAVERIDETGAFQQIGQVAAAGYSVSTTGYNFLDPQPLPGFNYYRLKMVDADGSSELSNVISVANRYGSFVGNLFPNPAEDHINVAIDGADDMDVYLRVLDASGRLIREHRTRTASGQQTVTMPLQGIESGQYLLMATLSTGESHTAGRFVVR